MTKDEAEYFVDQVMEAIPEPIAEALELVTVYVVEGREDPELKDAIRNAGMKSAQVRQDFRGLYLGNTLEPGALARGSIVLNAAALEEYEDVRDTLAHEIGHALGMSEAEVEDMGLG